MVFEVVVVVGVVWLEESCDCSTKDKLRGGVGRRGKREEERGERGEGRGEGRGGERGEGRGERGEGRGERGEGRGERGEGRGERGEIGTLITITNSNSTKKKRTLSPEEARVVTHPGPYLGASSEDQTPELPAPWEKGKKKGKKGEGRTNKSTQTNQAKLTNQPTNQIKQTDQPKQ